MSKFVIMRSDIAMPANMAPVADFLFRSIDGFRQEDKRAWRNMWKRVYSMEPGELIHVEMTFPRSGQFHRRHMAIEQAVFESQERFYPFEVFRDWVKVGSGWVDWVAGPRGGVFPKPKSISYAKADEEEFRKFHELCMGFFRGQDCAPRLWPHLPKEKAYETMEAILGEFGE